MSYKSLIRLISNGDNVDAATIDAALSAIIGNTDYLKELIEATLRSEAVYARCVTVEADALKGMPVYFNPTTQQFERGLAAADVNADTGVLVTSPSTQVWGVVYEKHNSTLADIILSGYVALDISAATAIAEPQTAGVYYLSGCIPGGLTQQEPPVSVPVLQSDGNGHILVSPVLFDALEQHKHYKFELVCRPAGDTNPPAPGDRHTIENADSSIEGWLPADDAIFEGKAPANAAFGYNLSASKLNSLWPPLPLGSVYVEWYKATDPEVGGTGVPLGTDGLMLVDNCGIWWLSDCYGDVPWALALESIGGSDESAVSDASDDVECPRNLYMKMFVWFTKMVFQTSGTVVTSLTAKAGSHLTITCAQNGEPASTGPLEIDLDLDFVTGSDTESGHLVFKDLVGNEFRRGPVVSSVKSGSSNVTITSSQTIPSSGKAFADLSISVDNDIDGKELAVQVARLNAATEEKYRGTLGLGLTSGKTQSYIGQINVPVGNVPDGTQMKLRFRVLARASGAFPELTLSVLRIPTTTVDTPADFPALAPAVTLDPTLTDNFTVDQYVDVESSAFDIAEGDTIYFTLGRVSSGAGPTITILRHSGVIVVA